MSAAGQVHIMGDQLMSLTCLSLPRGCHAGVVCPSSAGETAFGQDRDTNTSPE